MKRVVVTGIGLVTPLGCGVDSNWHNLMKGVSGANKITKFDVSDHKCKFACEVPQSSELENPFWRSNGLIRKN